MPDPQNLQLKPGYQLITSDTPAPNPQASALQGALAYSATQNPDNYAKRLQLQKQTGIGPVVSEGNEEAVRQIAAARALDPHAFAASNPRTTAWASNPDNAAVAGVPEIQRQGAIEQNAAAMRSAPPQPAPASPTLMGEFWNALKDAFSHPLETLVGADTPAAAAEKQATVQQFEEDAKTQGGPLALGVASGAELDQKLQTTPLLSVPNGKSWISLSRTPISATPQFQRMLSPTSQNVLSRGLTGAVRAIEGLTTPGNIEQLATLSLAPEDAAPIVSGVFGTQLTEGVGPSAYNAIHDNLAGDTGGAAENTVMALINAEFARRSVLHAVGTSLPADAAESATQPMVQQHPSVASSSFLSNLSQAVETAASSALRERAPDKFYEANQANFAGDPSLRIPADKFDEYFRGQSMDPRAVASALGSTNYVEAAMSGGDVEIPPADFLSKLDAPHQRALLTDVVDPSTGLTARQDGEGRAELQQWVAGGAAEKLVNDVAAADAETAASPEYAAVKEDLRGRYVAAGESPEVAETLATKDANVYTNLAREANLKPSELVAMYNPKVTAGDAPAEVGDALHQKSIEDIRSAVRSATTDDAFKDAVDYAPASPWLQDAARDHGVDLKGFRHAVDADSIRHALNAHGDAETEIKRGQLPIGPGDFEKLPEIVADPDRVVFGGKTKRRGLDSIGYVKRLEDGTVAHVEERRTGKKHLASVTMVKHPAGADVDRVAENLHLNARSGGSGVEPIIVRGPNADKADLNPDTILHQSQIPNWFRKLPVAAEGEDHPALAELRNRAAASGVPLTEEQEGAAREAIDAAARGDDEVWSAAQEKYQALRDTDPRMAELRAAQDTYSKLQGELTENPTPKKLAELEAARKVVDAEHAKLMANAPKPEMGVDSGQPRGWFRALPDGSFEIGKTKIGDLSTFVHEPAHAYLFMLRDLAARDDASETLKDDYAKVLKFLDVKEGEPLTTEQHEKWAQANEQYLREGKAPSAGLKGVFQRFAIWLGSVYQRATDLGVELSPEIRDVFDRMYAAEEGVNRAEAEAGPQLFKSPEEAGFTPEQFEKYAAANEMSVEQAKAEILGKLNEAAERERTAAWREEERNVRQAMTDSVDAQPAQRAIRSLRKGELEDGTPLTLNRQALVDQFGEDRVKALQELHRGIYRNEGGTDAETAAELHGFGSGEEMIRAMEATPRRSAAIEAATREYMTAKHGDIRYDGTLGDQARLALENNEKANVLHGELLALKQKLAEMKGTKAALRAIDVAPIAAYRELAEQAIARKSAADLQPTRYLDASRKYSRESFEAAIKGDVEAAAEAKHKELLNHFLFREAQKAKDFVDRTFEPFRKRAQGKTVQESLGKAGPEYRAQFNQLMARYEVAFVPRSEAPEGTLAQWASDQYDMGKEPAIDPAILNEMRQANYRSIPMSELEQLHDALQNIKALAYQELRMVVNGRKVEFAKAMADMIGRATESLDTRPARVLKRNATLGEKASDLVQRGDALLMRTERLMEWLDGGKTGPWHDNLWHLAADSQGREYALQEEVTKKIGDSLEALPKDQRLKMAEKVMIDGISEPITRHDLVSMALNMGNDGNFDRLTKTFEAHGWNPDALEQVKGALTREEWQHVQNLWEMLKPLGEHMKDMERRLTGVPPAMVKPTPFRVEFADGTHMDLDGGYYPIMMDPRFSKVGAAADAGMTAQNLMETGYGRAETSKGYTKGRTGYGGPLLLDYEQVLTQHTAKVIKDITHREFMLTANKLLMDQGVRSTLSSTLGSAYEEQMMPWLRTIINDRNGSATQGLGDFSRWMRAARTNMVMATIPFKIGTSLLQWTHAPRMLLSTNAGSFAQSLVNFMAHPVEMTQQIRDLSPNEMKFRGENLDRDVRAALNGQPGMQKKIAEVGGISIKYTDHLLSFPLWHSVYQDALKEHVDLPQDEAQYQAVQKADSAVRLGLGSASPKDLPPIMRNNDFAKFFTTFYSFHNGIYGQVRDIVHQVDGWGDVPKMTYGLALAVVVPSLIGSLVTGNGPKDKENVGLWAAKRALLFSSDTIPIVRDVAAGLDHGGDVKFNPMMDVLSKGAKTALSATADKEDKDWSGIGLGALETAGELGGVPGTAQAMKPLRYWDNASKGKVENPNVWDAFVGAAPRR